MQDEIWHQFGIQNYNGNVLSVYSVDVVLPCDRVVIYALYNGPLYYVIIRMIGRLLVIRYVGGGIYTFKV